jgi:DNA-binding CsgD family transcriptional regulator/tetratricopeptide (TPR) repeat protein
MKEIERRDQVCIPDSPTNLLQLTSTSSVERPRRPTQVAAFAAGNTSDVRGRLTSTRFVGRQPQLTEVQLAFREACDQRPRMILLGGDSGIGKSRFLAEAERLCEDARVLLGQCVEQGEVELPYAPLLGALRPLARERDPVLDKLSAAGRAGLAPLLPSVGAAAGATEAGFSGQIRLFESLLELLHLLSSEQPVVLVLEDMHWADGSTRAFVAFLARSLTDERLMLLLSYRSDELHRQHPLRPLIAELSRLELCRRVELEPLGHGELAEVLEGILGEAPNAELTDRLMERTEGNPLYVEELLAASLDGRSAAPESLRDTFLLRVERLSDDAGRVVRAVAVGRSLDERLIERVSHVGGSQLRAALREAVTDYVLVTDTEGRFGFRHALLREVITGDLLPGERTGMHLELARALEDAGPEICAEDEIQRIGTIASNYAAAGEQTAALRTTVRAAREAQRVHAYDEAASLYERALDLWLRVPTASEVAGLDEVDLLGSAAAMYALEGDQRRTEMLIERALEKLDQDDDPIRYARLLVRRGRSRWRLNRPSEAAADAEHALALLPEEPNADRARLLSWVARTQVLRGRYREAIVQGEPALAMAQAEELPITAGEALNTLGMARIALGEVDSGEALLREAIRLASVNEDVDDLGTAYSNLADFLSIAGRTADALAVINEGIAELQTRAGRAYSWMVLTHSVLAFEAGDWDAARASEGPPIGSVDGVILIFRLLRDAELALGLGDETLATERLAAAEPLVKVSREAQWHGWFGSVLGELNRRAGDLQGGQQAVSRALDELEVCTDDVMRIARVTAVGMAIEADRALRARDLREPETERDALTRARIHLDRLDAAAQDGGPVERAWLVAGLAENARAGGDNEPGLWENAAVAWEQLGRPYRAALMRGRRAEALVEADDREQAAEVLAGTLMVAQQLGAGWLIGELNGLAARGRLESPAVSDAAVSANGSTDNDQPESPFGLTPREQQVLALIAEGATNRQIGAALYMAEKTASVHVSRILSKLGVQSRTQAAAVAHRMHLT